MTQLNVVQDPTRAAYYQRISAANLAPLWEVLGSLVPPQPQSPCVPAYWNYAAIRPALLESGTLISAREAVRRVLILENPGLRGSSCITRSLYAGLQLILPGEIAPTHRHTQSALRFVVEGRGAFTAVNGERTTMEPGDFILTPAWTWHDHGNPAAEPVIWLDGLDIPMLQLFDAGFAENFSAEVQPVERDEGTAQFRYGQNMLPVDFAPQGLASPVFVYPYARSREALAQLARRQAPDARHGIKLAYVNPSNGGAPMPTIGAFLQWLPTGFSGAPHRSSDGTIYCVVEGQGRARIGEIEFAFAPRDLFVVPSWYPLCLEADAEAVLFSFSDRPAQQALGLWRSANF
jgi:gentisate 1,2-dioxygenase